MKRIGNPLCWGGWVIPTNAYPMNGKWFMAEVALHSDENDQHSGAKDAFDHREHEVREPAPLGGCVSQLATDGANNESAIRGIETKRNGEPALQGGRVTHFSPSASKPIAERQPPEEIGNRPRSSKTEWMQTND